MNNFDAVEATSEETATNDTFCGLCEKWYPYAYYKLRHSLVRCVPAAAMQLRRVAVEDAGAVGCAAAAPPPAEPPSKQLTSTSADDAQQPGEAAMQAEDLVKELLRPKATGLNLAQLTPVEQHQLAVETYLVAAMSGGELQGLLDLWKVWPGQTFTPSSLNAKQVTERVTRELLGEGFIVVDVRDAAGLDYKVHKQPYWMPIRENMMGAVQQLISQCPADAFAKFPAYVHENGEKVYNEFWTGELWNETQAVIGRKHPIVWLVLWSDKASCDKMSRQMGHPLTVSIANTSVEYQRTQQGCSMLGLLPVLKQFDGETDEGFRARKTTVLQASMRLAVQQLKDACNQYHQVYWPDGSSDVCLVRLAAIMADLEEQWDLLCLKHSECRYPDVQYLIRADEITNLDKPLTDYKLRTEADHKEALSYYNALKNTSDKKYGDALLDSLSLKPARYVALFDFGPTNPALGPPTEIFQRFVIDRLHQDFNGMSLHIITSLKPYLTDKEGLSAADADRVLGEVQRRLRGMRNLHEAFYPSEGIYGKMMHAEERRGLMKFLAAAMYGLFPDDVSELIAEYARWQHLRDSPTHTETSLKALDELGINVGKRMVATFEGVKSFEFAKFINMRKYAANIRQHGMVAMADTGPREAYIKFIRRAWLLTNRQPGTVDQQVATKVNFLDALQSAIGSIRQASARPPKGSGALQRAKAELGPSMLPGPGDTFTFSNMKREGTWEAQVYDAVPALSHMPVALQAFLQAGTAPEAVQIQKTLGLLRYEGVADVIHIHPAFYNRTKACLVPDSVAFNAWGKDREERDVQDTWYGQVIAVGRVDGTEFVFCRKYACPLALAEQAFLDGRSKGDSAFDDRGFPLTLRPLVWELYTPPAVGKKKVQTTSGSYCAISPEALLHKVCIMPDFKRDPAAPLPGQPRSSDEVDSQRHFLINDLVHTVSEEFICTAGGDDSAPALPPAAVGNAEPPSAAPRSSGYRDMQRQRGINELMCSQPAEVKAFWAEWFGCEAARLRAAIGAAPL